MDFDINEVVEYNYKQMGQLYVERNGFNFVSIHHPGNVFNTLLIHPDDAPCSSPLMPISTHSLEEHIQLIDDYNIESVMVIANSIDFITRCPKLKHVSITPADSAGEGFDYSPLYSMSNLKSVYCCTSYGANREYSTYVDYAKIKGLETVGVSDPGHKNFRQIETLKSLFVSGLSKCKDTDITQLFSSKQIDTFTFIQCKIKSLEGLQKSQKTQCVYLYYNRSLQDISALCKVKKTLKALCIENCPNITDFSWLGELENLEYLELMGKNELEDLSFLASMKNLKTLILGMNVINGDLTPCLRLSYVFLEKDRKHYNLKNSDLPKGTIVKGNEDIEDFRKTD